MEGNERESSNVLDGRRTSLTTDVNQKKVKKAYSDSGSLSFPNGDETQLYAYGGIENHDQNGDKSNYKLGNIPKKDSGQDASLAVENHEAHSFKQREDNAHENKRSLNRDDSGNDSQPYSPNGRAGSHQNVQFGRPKSLGSRDGDNLTPGNPNEVETQAATGGTGINVVNSDEKMKLGNIPKKDSGQGPSLVVENPEAQNLMPPGGQANSTLSSDSLTQDRALLAKDLPNNFHYSPAPKHIPKPTVMPPGRQENRNSDSLMQDRSPLAKDLPNSSHDSSSSEHIPDPLMAFGAQADYHLSLSSFLRDSIPLVREIPSAAQVSRSLLNQMADELMKARHSNQLLSQELSRLQAEKRQWTQKDVEYQSRISELEKEVIQTVKFQKDMLEQKLCCRPSPEDLGYAVRPPLAVRPDLQSLESSNGVDSEHSHSDQGNENTQLKQVAHTDRGSLTYQQAVSSLDEEDGVEDGIEEICPDENTQTGEGREHETDLKTPV